MANEQNLKPMNELTEKERRELAQKGGKASAEARRKKRDLKLAIQMLLEQEIEGKNGEKKTGAEAIAVAQFKKALKGDTRAFEVLRDTAGQKPVDKVEQVNIDGEYLDRVNELKAFFDGESKPGDTKQN